MGYKNEKLWNLLIKKSEEFDNEKPVDSKNAHAFIAGVGEICDFAINRAKAIRDTFPTYTLHDETHVCNVLRLMESLLGNRIEELTRDETAMLILSACCHDIGMSYNDDDKKDALDNRDRLDKYLDQRPSEYVKAYENGIEDPILTEEMAQNYFRSIHHERVQDLLYTQEWPPILNGCVDREDLIMICQSHGENISGLNEMNSTPTIDLRMCSILLRLSDILDFDTSRVPKSLYDYDNISTNPNKITQNEWDKHYSSNGFNFYAITRELPYLLPFSANCKSMQIEHLVQVFLNWIDSELNNCERLLSKIAGRWQNLVLPEKIERRIIPEGYVSGEYHLTLDHEQVIELLAGRDLYGDPSVFVRELLQNAIDSVRTRSELDKNLPPNWKPQIKIRTWTDEEGYQWFRIEDNGIGMTEETIRNYLLKIGRSYYNSSEFKKDKLRYNANPDYMPISRFGIGILSCFIGGDQIEISTKRFKDNNQIFPGYRLKMQGLNGYFFLTDSSKRHRPGPMKGVTPEETPPFRNEAGTVVAVRTNLYKSGAYSGFKEIVSNYLLYPSVPVQYDGPDGSCHFMCEDEFIDSIKELSQSDNGCFEFGLSEEQMNELNELMPGFVWIEKPKAIVQCAVFDRFLPNKYMNGVVVSGWAVGDAEERTIKIGRKIVKSIPTIDLTFNEKNLELRLHIGYEIPDNIRDEARIIERSYEDLEYEEHVIDRESIFTDVMLGYHKKRGWKSRICDEYNLSKKDLDILLSEIEEKAEMLADYKKIEEKHIFVVHKFDESSWYNKYFRMAIEKSIIIHNGIIIDDEKEIITGTYVNLGTIVLLKDKYRPNVDVSRSEVKSITIETAVAICILQQAMSRQNANVECDLSELDDAGYRYLPLSKMLDVLDNMAEIAEGVLVETKDYGALKIAELLDVVKLKGSVILSDPNAFMLYGRNNDFIKHITIALIRKHFDCFFKGDSVYSMQFAIRASDNYSGLPNYTNFPANLFIPYEGKNASKFASAMHYSRKACNAKHAFSIWIATNQPILQERVPGILHELLRNILDVSSEEMIANVKSLLDRIRSLPNNPIPVPDNVYLTEADFY